MNKKGNEKMKNLTTVRIFTTVIGLALLVGLSGCMYSQPEPYKVHLKQSKSDLTWQEKSLALDKAIDGTFYGNKYGCVVTGPFKDCYKLKDNNIERVNISYHQGPSSYNRGNHHQKIKDIEKNLQAGFEKELVKYQVYKDAFKKADQGLEAKLSTMKVSLVDSTNILSSDALKAMNKISVKSSATTRDSFRSYKFDERIDKIFNIVTEARYNYYNRYQAEFSGYRFVELYTKVPDDRKIKITRVKYSYLPSEFIARDKNIEVIVKNNILGKGAIHSIVVQNNTKEFIELNTISGYYGGAVTINILNSKTNKIQIPPMSNITLTPGQNDSHAVYDFPEKKYLYATDRKQKVSYGFSVAYIMVNQNANKNIYKVTDYTINKLDAK